MSIDAITLINGICDRNHQSKEAYKERVHKEYLANMEHEHRDLMQWNEHRFLEETQRKEHDFQLEQQREAFKLDVQKDIREDFVKNSWPFILPPEQYEEMLEKYKGSAVFPLNVIIPNQSFPLDHIDNFFSAYYQQTETPVFERSGDWKEGFLTEMRQNGTALIQNIWKIFRFPTIVLMPVVSDDHCYIKTTYWGRLDEKTPSFWQIFPVNYKKRKLAVIREEAKTRWREYEEMGEECPKGSNAQIWHEEQLYIQKKQLEGKDDEKIQNYCDCVFGVKYSVDEVKEKWEPIMTAYISLSMELAGCIVADMYFLSESNAAPKFPKLFEIMSHLYSKEKQDEIVAFIENVFREMIENERRLLAKDREKYENFELNNDNIPPNLQSVLKTEVFNSSRHSHVALHAALIAKAFGQSGYDDISQIFVEMAREDLQQSIHANEPLEEQENVIHIIPYINNENIQELLSPAKERREIERLRKIGGPKRGEDWKTFLNGKIDLEMVWVECGSFTMGDKYDVSDSALHTVTLTKGYWIGKYPLTQEQWEAIGCKRKEENYFQGVRLPVECISWDEAISFCQKLNEIMKDKLPRGYHFNLPTEAQWEFAAKGGIYSKGYEYSGSNQLDEVGWYDGNSEIKRRDEKGVVRIDYKGTHPVGQKKPNELGIYDMNGNVFEWCWNYFDKYPEEDETDPIGPENGKFRVFRGGSWDCPTQNCRPSYRYLLAPIGRISIVGFRVALVPVKDYK